MLLPMYNSQTHVDNVCQNKANTTKYTAQQPRCGQEGERKDNHQSIILVQLFTCHGCENVSFCHSINSQKPDAEAVRPQQQRTRTISKSTTSIQTQQ